VTGIHCGRDDDDADDDDDYDKEEEPGLLGRGGSLGAPVER